MKTPSQGEYAPGHVFQINENDGRPGWVGAFVLATEIKTWGIQGYVPHIESHEQQERAYIRMPWERIEPIGRAVLIPEELQDDRLPAEETKP